MTPFEDPYSRLDLVSAARQISQQFRGGAGKKTEKKKAPNRTMGDADHVCLPRLGFGEGHVKGWDLEMEGLPSFRDDEGREQRIGELVGGGLTGGC